MKKINQTALPKISVWGGLFIVSIGWGTGGTAIRYLYNNGEAPFTLIAVRTIIAALALIVFLAFWNPEIPKDPLTWKVGAVLGVSYLCAFSCFVAMLGHASAGFAGLFGGLSPLTTAVWAAYIFRDQRLQKKTMMGLLLGGMGILVLALNNDSGLAIAGRPIIALGFGIISVTLIGFGVAYSNRHAEAVDAAQLTAIQMSISSVLSILLAYLIEGGSFSYSAGSWLAVAYLGIIATAMPFVLFLIILRQTMAIRASLVGYLIPVIAVTSGLLILDEKLQWGIIGGGALILMGLLIANRSELHHENNLLGR